MKENILNQFDQQQHLYLSFAEKCQNIIVELLTDNSLFPHQVNCRVKDKTKLARKIDLKREKYSVIADITDLAGVRIITYLESDVDKIASIIESEFQIDRENSVDKRKLKANEFGYKSLHYVISLNDDRLRVSEYKKFATLKCEIQIRSILQHAWAEIEHDLGYKGEISIPEEFKRTFNRIAAQLETADVEFDRLKKALTQYEREVQKTIALTPEDVSLDQASILSFIETDGIVHEANNTIKNITGCQLVSINDVDITIRTLKYHGLKTIGELKMLLKKESAPFLKFLKAYLADVRYKTISCDISLFYFSHYLAAKTQNIESIKKYFKENRMSPAGSEKFLHFYQTSQ